MSGGARPYGEWEAEQAYLQALHCRFAAPSGLVDRLVREATGARVLECRRHVAGNDNEVYVVETEGDRRYVLRIHRQGETGLHEEAWALEACRAAGVPVPEVVSIGYAEKGLEWMLQSRVPGRALSDRWVELDPSARRRCLRQMGEALSGIHSVRAGGFYKRHVDGVWDFADWMSLVQCSIRERTAEWPFVLAAGVTEAEWSEITGHMARYAGDFSCDVPVLCHGDYSPGHVFFDDDLRLTAVIDFGGFQGAHPMHDFTILRMDCGEEVEAAVRAGYAAPERLGERYELHLRLDLLMTLIGYLAHHTQLPGHPGVGGYVRGLRETLAWLRSHSRA
jgi:aminoglycoside phosphotransferase (APT) family kinase protein